MINQILLFLIFYKFTFSFGLPLNFVSFAVVNDFLMEFNQMVIFDNCYIITSFNYTYDIYLSPLKNYSFCSKCNCIEWKELKYSNISCPYTKKLLFNEFLFNNYESYVFLDYDAKISFRNRETFMRDLEYASNWIDFFAHYSQRPLKHKYYDSIFNSGFYFLNTKCVNKTNYFTQKNLTLDSILNNRNDRNDSKKDCIDDQTLLSILVKSSCNWEIMKPYWHCRVMYSNINPNKCLLYHSSSSVNNFLSYLIKDHQSLLVDLELKESQYLQPLSHT